MVWFHICFQDHNSCLNASTNWSTQTFCGLDTVGRKHQERPSSQLFQPCSIRVHLCCIKLLCQLSLEDTKICGCSWFYYVLDLRIILIAKSVDLTFPEICKGQDSPQFNNFHQPSQSPCCLCDPLLEGSNAISSHIGWLRASPSTQIWQHDGWTPPKKIQLNQEQNTHDFRSIYE